MTPAIPFATPTTDGALAVIGESELRAMAAAIRAKIPGAEVRLFGSRARGDARPDSDVDLLITAPDAWLAEHNRGGVLDRLRWQLSGPDIPVDLLLFSQSQARHRRDLRSDVVHCAHREGVRVDG
jgi:predicted nucleotidyltransferase